ncbi:MAG: polysaccharide deacetylase family protein [Thermoanaerobaculia bacterium]|nr:polysaccharide deacetylase family protein [Thermoanaerobaculia bacterium]
MSGRAGGAVSTRLGRSPTGWLPRRFLPILMYHRIGDAARDDPGGLPSLWLTEAALRRQLAWLAAEGYRSLSLDEAHAALIAGSPPAKAVVLTFDDGYDESIARAGAALADAGLRAAVFVAAAQVGREVRVGHPTAEGWTAGRVAGRDELLGWLDAGLDVGCHSMTHADLTAATQASLVEETRDARRRLEDLLGRPVPDFC